MVRKFNDGDIVYHKATLKRCVVIKSNEDNTIKVRDQDNIEIDYYPQELRTEAEIENRNKSFLSEIPDDTGSLY